MDKYVASYKEPYNLINQSFFIIDEQLKNITNEQVFNYSEKVKGKLEIIVNEEQIIPQSLVELFEKALYESSGFTSNEIQDYEDLTEVPYFNLTKKLGSQSFKLTLEQMKKNFPKQLNNEDLNDKYEAYKYIANSDNAQNIFRLNDEMYLINYTLGGSNGANENILYKLINGELVNISSFKSQNNGFGEVIYFENYYYYVFLEYNYNLKNYSGIRIHRLGEDSAKENLQIKYLPENYYWKNIYNMEDENTTEINEYLKDVESTITSHEYLEKGYVNDMEIIFGDETIDYKFLLSETYKEYYKIDLANIGIPVYYNKSNHIPSNKRNKWSLRSEFYLLDPITDTAMQLEKLSFSNNYMNDKRIVQMWFKKFGNKIYTFHIIHYSDYNYILTIDLIEGDKKTQVRQDILSPSRKFILTEGVEYKDY